ncbi:MAG TPA: hypothetical protein VL754_22040 [Verrucomicrobiae bacterium]|jgi:hypothetical protein|nr:hypothetical protein [Verrucomicrobiae bacterium]
MSSLPADALPCVLEDMPGDDIPDEDVEDMSLDPLLRLLALPFWP